MSTSHEQVPLDRLGRLNELLAARTVDPAIVSLILDVARCRPVEACTEQAQQLPLAAAADAYAAVYVARRSVSIALDRERARRVHDRHAEEHGLRLEEKTDVTSYVHVGAGPLANAPTVALVRALLVEALDRSDSGPRWQRGLPDREMRRGGICQRCGYAELSVTGVCATCD